MCAQFHSSEHEGGVDVFLHELFAERITGEVAEALQITNGVLVKHNFLPLGLAAEGHTSASLHGHEESVDISTRRARRCSESIRRHLARANEITEADELWGEPISRLITHRGCGNAQALEGFDDGRNHWQNRRVEMRLLEPHEEGYCSDLPRVPTPEAVRRKFGATAVSGELPQMPSSSIGDPERAQTAQARLEADAEGLRLPSLPSRSEAKLLSTAWATPNLPNQRVSRNDKANAAEDFDDDPPPPTLEPF
jgi:hypothetical protein